MADLKPTPFSNTDTAETESVVCLEKKLDFSLVKSFIKTRDKVPDVDGYLQLVENNISIGKIEAQVRSIPGGSTSYPCPIGLYGHAKTGTTLPVIFIGVDRKNDKIFWKEIKPSDAVGKEHQKTLTLHFQEPEDLIDASSQYIGRWRAILKEYREAIDRHAQLKEAASELDQATLLPKDVIARLQVFVDEFNRLLDSEYPQLKRLRFPGIWKIGIGLGS